MSRPFSNPITGGGGALVRPSIHSPDFQSGVKGWSINKDGSAEFASLTIDNGTIIITFTDGSILKLYGGAYTNSGPQGGFSGQTGVWATFQPATDAGVTWQPGAIGCEIIPGPPDGGALILASPAPTNTNSCQVFLESAVGAAGPAFSVDCFTGVGSLIDLTSDTVQVANLLHVFGDLTVDGVNGFKTVVKPSTTSIAGTVTFQTDPALQFPIIAGQSFIVEATVLYQSPNAGGYKCQWSLPAGVTMPWATFLGLNSAGTTVYNVTGANGSISGLLANGGTVPLFIRALVVSATGAGQVAYQFAQNVASGTFGQLVNSTLRYERVA